MCEIGFGESKQKGAPYSNPVTIVFHSLQREKTEFGLTGKVQSADLLVSPSDHRNVA